MEKQHIQLSYWHPICFDAATEKRYASIMSQRSLPLLRLASIIGALAFLGYQFWDLLLDQNALATTGPIRLLVVLLFGAGFLASYLPVVRRSPRFIYLLLILVYTMVAIMYAWILARLPSGFSVGTSGFILGMIFIPVLVWSYQQAISVVLPLVALPLAAMFLADASQFEIINAAAWTIGGASFVVGFAYLLDVINRRSFQLERLLEEEKEKSDTLLLNILPEDVALRLKLKEELLADHHDQVSVLFADLVGFTPLSRELSASQLVNLLNDLFSRFDMLTEQYGVEKIKTIGDAYMAATGLAGDASHHADRIADLALAMQAECRQFQHQRGVSLKVRIGIHSGTVVAGVIGKRKFAYDLWGDTVNIASRMESEGLPDEIQISAETRNLLSDRFRTEARGEITVKGHAPRIVYLLKQANTD